MDFRLTRRRLLQGSAALGASTLAAGLPRVGLRGAREHRRSASSATSRTSTRRTASARWRATSCAPCMRRLVMFKPGIFEWEPDAAETITQVDDKTIEFTLKPGIMFQQGYGELTAEDVKFSYERFNNPKRGRGAGDLCQGLGRARPCRGDRHAFRPHHPEEPGAGALGDRARRRVGLHRLQEGLRGARREGEDHGDRRRPLHLRRVEAEREHHAPRRSRLYRARSRAIKEIVLRPIQEPKTAQLAFRSDELHFTKLDDPAGAEALADDPTAEIIKQPSINYVWVGMNVEKKPLDDIRVRQAIRKAIDVDQAILAGYNGTVDARQRADGAGAARPLGGRAGLRSATSKGRRSSSPRPGFAERPRAPAHRCSTSRNS